MKPWNHARGSVSRWGGKPEDYLPIHDFIDSTKAAMPDLRHRAVLHNAMGIFIVERVFGPVITNSDGKQVSTRDVAEHHVIEDMGFIPSLEDWLDELPQSAWHGGIHRLPKNQRPQPKDKTMALKTMIENITRAREAYEKAKAAIGDDAAKGVAEHLAAAIPAGFAVRWHQYTPYFNDGEACVFHVTDPALLKLAPEADLEDVACVRHGDSDGSTEIFEELTWSAAYYGKPRTNAHDYTIDPIDGLSKEDLEKMAAAWRELPEDLLEAAFGDHAAIVVAHGGSFVRSEYDHD